MALYDIQISITAFSPQSSEILQKLVLIASISSNDLYTIADSLFKLKYMRLENSNFSQRQITRNSVCKIFHNLTLLNQLEMINFKVETGANYYDADISNLKKLEYIFFQSVINCSEIKINLIKNLENLVGMHYWECYEVC